MMPSIVEICKLGEFPQLLDQGLHQLLGRRSTGGNADALLPPQQGEIELRRILYQITGHTVLVADFAQAVGIGAVLGADHQHQVYLGGQHAHGSLTILGRVANIFDARSDDLRKALPQGCNHVAGVVDRQRRLGDIGDLVGVADLEGVYIGDIAHQQNRTRNLADGAFHLGVVLVADQDEVAALGRVTPALYVYPWRPADRWRRANVGRAPTHPRSTFSDTPWALNTVMAPLGI